MANEFIRSFRDLYKQSDTEGLRVHLVGDIAEASAWNGVGTVGTTVTSIDIPVGAIGFTVKSEVNPVYFAIDETPETDGTLASLGVGNVSMAGETAVRLLSEGASALKLICTADTTVYVNFY